MAKKKKHDEHVNHERWLVSYADFITLLFAFFVVLFSSSQVDRSKTKKMALAMESAFDRFAIFKFQSGDELDESNAGGSGGSAKRYREYLIRTDSGNPVVLPPEISYDESQGLKAPTGNPEYDKNTGYLSTDEQALERTQRHLLALVYRKKYDSLIDINLEDRGVVISVRSAGMFKPGSDEIIGHTHELIRDIAAVIWFLPNQVRVEGHTDDQELVMGSDQSHWDLSAKRATRIVKLLTDKYEMDPRRFSAIGYGSYRPLSTADTEAARDKNRRVDIVLLSELAARKEALVKDAEVEEKEQLPIEMMSEPEDDDL